MRIHALILTAGLALVILSDANAKTLYGVFWFDH
jgi:hypothetical protein